MIIARAPLRISFVGGGTDLPDFYTKTPGQVISGAINKYVYVTVTETPFRQIALRYSIGEIVKHPKELKNDRVREALLDIGMTSGVEISTFSHLPGQTGLGSSSAFSVALIKALNTLLGNNLTPAQCAEGASRLEIDLVGEPIGKQDQYASSFGGINVFEFQKNHNVEVKSLHLDFKRQLDFEQHLLLFFTGVTRKASDILGTQKKNIDERKHFNTLKKMAASVPLFETTLMKGEFKKLGALLHEGWIQKRTLASGITNPVLDILYNTALKQGAFGGKVLGAGGGGCLLFLAPPEEHKRLRKALESTAKKQGLVDAAVIPFSFVQSGAEIVVNTKE
jgi:D-glycero-alpha-D-manno-heptose-7-phosphate kinase